MHKLSPPLEGPLVLIQKVLTSGAYRLKNQENGKIIPGTYIA
jgi:hypothetical protein